MLLELKSGCVYGPVQSRRLGRSLGINALPSGCKVCTFDCQYCQYGWTPSDCLTRGHSFPTVAAILAEVEAALHHLSDPPAFLTFSGHGEPTLHPGFPRLVDGLITLRDRALPSARTAILSNSSRVGDPDVRTALRRLDARIMKLDAGSQVVLDAFNQPLEPLAIDELVDGLGDLGEVTLQALFADGQAGNHSPEHVAAWLTSVERIRPVAVQVYTLDRDVPSRHLAPVPGAELQAIAAAVQARGITATAY
jgi:wyosine [tRNA(Phe)-imidazoG37] synthetase (radical SAM superfamily)